MSNIWVAVSAVAGLAGIIITYLAYRERHNDRISQRQADFTRQIVHTETEALPGRLLEISARLDAIIARQDQLAQDIHEQGVRTGTVLDRLTTVETKIELWWRSVAMDAARIIHSPDPQRAHVDALLEAFMNGVITPDQEQELKSVLVTIRDHDPGAADAGFPVHPGEQVAAAILLRTMDHAIPRRKGNA